MRLLRGFGNEFELAAAIFQIRARCGVWWYDGDSFRDERCRFFVRFLSGTTKIARVSAADAVELYLRGASSGLAEGPSRWSLMGAGSFFSFCQELAYPIFISCFSISLYSGFWTCFRAHSDPAGASGASAALPSRRASWALGPRKEPSLLSYFFTETVFLQYSETKFDNGCQSLSCSVYCPSSARVPSRRNR